MPFAPSDEDQAQDELDYARLAMLLAQADLDGNAYDVLRDILVQLADCDGDTPETTH